MILSFHTLKTSKLDCIARFRRRPQLPPTLDIMGVDNKYNGCNFSLKSIEDNLFGNQGGQTSIIEKLSLV